MARRCLPVTNDEIITLLKTNREVSKLLDEEASEAVVAQTALVVHLNIDLLNRLMLDVIAAEGSL